MNHLSGVEAALLVRRFSRIQPLKLDASRAVGGIAAPAADPVD